jgi:hypothetical protein
MTTMTGGIRKVALTAHISSSVGWFGAVACFECLAIIGMSSSDVSTVRSVYLPMEQVAWFVIVPFACASLLSGIVMSLGTKWGLFRHYWVLAKLAINTIAIALLLLHTRLIHVVASAAGTSSPSATELNGLRVRLVIVAGVALVALATATTLAVFKPRGMTPYGRRQQAQDQLKATTGLFATHPVSGDGLAGNNRSWAIIILLVALSFIVLSLVVFHFAGGGHGNHG